MARIEFNSTEGNKSGGSWQPLPNGQYVFQIDAIEKTVSSNKNPQLKISTHVVDGPHANEKATMWYSLVPEAGWRLEILLKAALQEGQYEQIDTGETRVNKKTGAEEPIYTFSFDTDDMIGAQIVADATQREYNGKINNDFNIVLPDAEEEAPTQKAAPKAVARPAAAPARATATTVPTANAPRRRQVAG